MLYFVPGLSVMVVPISFYSFDVIVPTGMF